MDERRLPSRAMDCHIEGTWNVGRQPKRWIDNIKDDIADLGINIRTATDSARDRRRRKHLVTNSSATNGWRKSGEEEEEEEEYVIHWCYTLVTGRPLPGDTAVITTGFLSYMSLTAFSFCCISSVFCVSCRCDG